MADKEMPPEVRRAFLLEAFFKEGERSFRASKQRWQLLLICREKLTYPAEHIHQSIQAGHYEIVAPARKYRILDQLKEIDVELTRIATQHSELYERLLRIMKQRDKAAKMETIV